MSFLRAPIGRHVLCLLLAGCLTGLWAADAKPKKKAASKEAARDLAAAMKLVTAGQMDPGIAALEALLERILKKYRQR